MAELKPCPFCVGEAKVQSFPHNHTVYCTVCNARVQVFLPTREKAIEAWNRRADNAD